MTVQFSPFNVSRILVRQACALLAGLVAVCMGSSALAQAEIDPPKPFELSDKNYVDLLSLTVNPTTTTISIGPEKGGLSYSATYVMGPATWRHNTFGGIYRRVARSWEQDYQWYQVSVPGAGTVSFRDDGFGTLELVGSSGAGTLVISGGTYLYTAGDGTLYTYSAGMTAYSPYKANKALLTRIDKPSGEVITYTYAAYTSGTNTAHRIQSISNTLGYQIHFDYVSNTGGAAGWGDVTKVTAFNMAVDACAPSAATCTFSQTWPSLTFVSNGLTQTATDALGRVFRITLDGYGRIAGIASPAVSSGSSLTYTWVSVAGGTRVATASDGLGTWSYSKTNPAIPNASYYDTTTTVTNPLSQTTKYQVEWMDPFGDGDFQPERVNRLIKVTNALNQDVVMMQDAVGPHWVIQPEGDRTNYSYHNGVLSSVTRIAKPGSGLSNTTISSGFANCSTPVLCGRPTSVTDAMGNVTDYTYDAAGNLLTETGPAPTPGAPRPQTRYVWEQRYAWYKQNGSSTITQAPTPVWVMVEQSQCMTGATC